MIDAWLIPHRGKRFKPVSMPMNEIVTTAKQLKDAENAGFEGNIIVSVEGDRGTREFPVKDIWVAEIRNK